MVQVVPEHIVFLFSWKKQAKMKTKNCSLSGCKKNKTTSVCLCVCVDITGVESVKKVKEKLKEEMQHLIYYHQQLNQGVCSFRLNWGVPSGHFLGALKSNKDQEKNKFQTT